MIDLVFCEPRGSLASVMRLMGRIGLFFDLQHHCAGLLTTDDKNFVITGINSAGHRNVGMPARVLPKNVSCERLHADDGAHFCRAASTTYERVG
jgi:hypothetical protein